MNFYQKILAEKQMILGLSPMDGISDFPFRAIVKKYGRADLIFTEFANVEGICRSSSTRILDHFDFNEQQRPFIAQIFGKTPAYFKQAAVLLCELGVDGIDINMGCPAPTVANHGSGAAIIKNPALAVEIIKAVQDGVNEWANGLELKDCPDIAMRTVDAVKAKQEKFGLLDSNRSNSPTVSVKTRIGYHNEEIETWLPTLIKMRLAAISLHGRTLKQGYSGKADWSVIGRAAIMIKKEDPSITFLGNGDVTSYEEAQSKVAEFGVDGVLIGRASFGRPHVFLPQAEQEKFLLETNIFEVALEHAKLYEAAYPQEEKYNFLPMRKHLAWYTRGIEAAASIRAELVRTSSAAEVELVLRNHHLID